MAEVYPLSPEPETPEPKLLPPSYGAQVIMGGRYVEDQEMAAFGLMGCLLGVGVGLIPTVLGFAKDAVASRFLRTIGPLYWVMLYAGLFRTMRGAAHHFHQYGWGAEGEDLMVEQIRRLLDHRWTIFCNVQLREGRAKVDLDIVLVGPGGVYAVEVKRPHQDTRCENGQWQRKTRDGWKPIRNHGKDVRAKARNLTKHLKQHGVTYTVQPAVALPQIFRHPTSCPALLRYGSPRISPSTWQPFGERKPWLNRIYS